MTSNGSWSRSRIPYGPYPQQFGDLTVPDLPGRHRILVFIHGGFWGNSYDLTLAEPQSSDAAACGYATWNIEYRRLGDPGGGYPGTLADVAAAVDHLSIISDDLISNDHQIDIGRVVVIGHSAGGHLALWVGQRTNLGDDAPGGHPRIRPALVVGQAPVSDLTAAAIEGMGDGAVVDLMGGQPADRPERYMTADPARLLPIDVPQLIVHGSADDRVPLEASRSYQRLASSKRLEIIEFAGADHFDVIDPSHESWEVVKTRAGEL